MEQSIVGYFLHASIVVKMVMFLLLLASVFSWAIILQKASLFRFINKQFLEFQSLFDSVDDLSEINKNLLSRPSIRANAYLFHVGFSEFLRYQRHRVLSEATLSSVERAVSIAEAKELEKLGRQLSILATIGSTSPYVGLFGTVWGIMTSFEALGNVQQATLQMVAPGISEALLATAMGLFAAIPAVIAYNRFNATLTTFSERFAIFREQMLTHIARAIHLPDREK